MAISLGTITTFELSSTGTSAAFSHTHSAGALVIRLGARGTSAVPANFQLSLNGSPLAALPNSQATNTSSRAATLFFAVESPPVGVLSINISWNNQANLVASALDVLGATLDGAAVATGSGYDSSVSLAIACPQNGIALDSVDANNGRDFSPLNGVTPHYVTLQTTTGDSDVSHRAGYKFASGATNLGWQIISTSNYVYSVIALGPKVEGPPPNNSAFMFFFGG